MGQMGQTLESMTFRMRTQCYSDTLHTYVDCSDPGRFLTGTKCSPFLAYRRPGADLVLGGIGCTYYRRNDSERDEENPNGEHGRARKGRVVEI